jgi:Arc/MetJ-type ribon-helix-helix transcriptional regulator
MFMGSLTIKLPDDQKSEIETLAEKKNYNSTSEYVREALRDKVEEDLVLRPEVAEELRKRIEEVQRGDADLISHEELAEELS